jgi:queuine/archaeosine tRNA-ribosyltransferase
MFLQQQVPAFQCSILHPLDVGQISPIWSGWRERPFGRWISDWQQQTSYPIPDNNRPDNGYPFRTIMNWWEFWQQPPGLTNRPPIYFSESGGHGLARETLRQKCEKFGLPISQLAILDLQQEMGADVVMSLDYPLTGHLNSDELEEHRASSIRNGLELLKAIADRQATAMPYVAVHGTSEADAQAYIDTFMDGWRKLPAAVRKIPFGIAVGSLHTKASQPEKLIDIMLGVREGLRRAAPELGSMPPVHVLGISSRTMAVLVYMGADTFSSQSYAKAAKRGEYLDRHLQGVNITKIDEAALADCGCLICSKLLEHKFLPDMQAMMSPKQHAGDEEDDKPQGVGRYYRQTATGEDYTSSDLSALLAMHNWIQVSREVERIRSAIQQDCLPEYIWALATQGPPVPRFRRAVEHLAAMEALAGDSHLKDAYGRPSPVSVGVPVPEPVTFVVPARPKDGRPESVQLTFF